jgi:hypothetical protein
MFDILQHDRKQNQVADRRPVIRKPSDLVGPGIGASATRVTDWNNVLATFNGYFSSVRALNGPRPETAGPDVNYDVHTYVGFVTMDAEYGGKQVITDLTTYIDYTRVFYRAPTDPNTIVWGSWVSSSSAPPSAFSEGNTVTNVVTATPTALNAPVLNGSNWEGTYDQNGTHLDILSDGVYTGVIRVYSFTSASGLNSCPVAITLPRGLATETLDQPSANLNAQYDGARFPFTFTSLLDTTFISVTVEHSVGSTTGIYWGIDITRVGGVR